MEHGESSGEVVDGSGNETGTTLGLPLPIRDSELFKHSASQHVLNFLSDNPDVNVSIRQLAAVTPMSERATREAVNVLEANELIATFHEGNARRVHVNKARLDKPDDPILNIPQTHFQTPVRVARHYVETELDDVKGVVLFGSVARGDADRRSDIDLWVLVASDHMQQRHEANKLAKRLEELQIPPTVAVADATSADFESNWENIRETLEDDDRDWASAERHSFEIIVETPQSIINQSDRIDSEKLFGKGITLLSTETLERVKLEVLGDE